jgi:hypothetical protein
MPVMPNQEALRLWSKAASVGSLFGVVPKRWRDFRGFSAAAKSLLDRR